MTPEEKILEIKRKYGGRLKIALNKAAKIMGQSIVDVILIRTRIEGQGTNGKLDRLEPSTKKYRKRYADNLHPDTSPNTSNLTATGQLLDAIKFTSGNGKVKVFIKNTKRKKDLGGYKSKLTNDEVRAEVEKSREFLKLSESEKEDATKLAANIIEEELRNLS